MNRALMAPIGSVLVSLRRREPCLVRPTAGGWSHRYREGVAVHPRWGGASARLQDQQARDHFLYGYEPSTGDTVLDVGAGVGGEVRLFSRLVGAAGRVVCVEAHPTTYALLSQTIALNRLTNVTPLRCALTDLHGTVFLEDDAKAHVNNGLTDPAGGIAVPGRTLEDVLRQAQVHRVDLLKLNIEGAELAALEAGRDALRRVRNIVVSCHDFKADADGRDWQRTYAPVRDLLTQAGFRLTTRPTDPRPWLRYYLYGAR
jgi:FkbM family methyltransferase